MKKTGVSVEKNFVNSKMCSSDADETGKMSSSLSSDACGDGCFAVKNEHN